MPNRNVKLEATLLSDSTPLQGKTIEFFHRVTGETQWTSDGTSETNENGIASKTISLTVPETYDFKAYFAGDNDYEPSEAFALAYRVKAKTSLSISVVPL